MIDDIRCCGRYYEADTVFDHQVVAADAVGLSVCWFDSQYFSDCNLHSGADAYLCAQSYLCIYFNYFIWQLDHDIHCGVYDRAVVKH